MAIGSPFVEVCCNQYSTGFGRFCISLQSHIYCKPTYRIKAPNAIVRICELSSGKTKSYVLHDKDEYEKALLKIKASVGEMAEFLEGGDTANNKALPKEKFPQKENHAECRTCPFCLMCAADAKAARKAQEGAGKAA